MLKSYGKGRYFYDLCTLLIFLDRYARACAYSFMTRLPFNPFLWSNLCYVMVWNLHHCYNLQFWKHFSPASVEHIQTRPTVVWQQRTAVVDCLRVQLCNSYRTWQRRPVPSQPPPPPSPLWPENGGFRGICGHRLAGGNCLRPWFLWGRGLRPNLSAAAPPG